MAVGSCSSRRGWAPPSIAERRARHDERESQGRPAGHGFFTEAGLRAARLRHLDTYQVRQHDASVNDILAFMRQAERAFSERDVDALIALTHPEAEMRLFANGRVTAYGREGTREIMAAAWGDPMYELSLERFERAGPDTVIGVGTVRRGVVGRSGFNQHTAAWLWTLEDGMIRRAETFATVEDARRAALALPRND